MSMSQAEFNKLKAESTEKLPKENITIAPESITKAKFLGRVNKPGDPTYRDSVIAQLIAYQERYQEELKALAANVEELAQSKDQDQDTLARLYNAKKEYGKAMFNLFRASSTLDVLKESPDVQVIDKIWIENEQTGTLVIDTPYCDGDKTVDECQMKESYNYGPYNFQAGTINFAETVPNLVEYIKTHPVESFKYGELNGKQMTINPSYPELINSIKKSDEIVPQT